MSAITTTNPSLGYTPVNYTPTTPLQVAPGACTLWIDAADASTVTGTTNVTAVKDKSGNNYNLTGGTGFSYPNNTFNGTYPSFYNPTALSTSAVVGGNSLTQTQPCTIYAVCIQTVSQATSYLFDSASVGGANRITISTQTNFRPVYYAGTSVYDSSSFLSTPSIISSAWNGASTNIWNNGTQVQTNINPGTGKLANFTLGTYWAGSGYSWLGHICEFIIFSGIHTQQQRQQVEGYLAWKWGLNKSLPSTHPYYYNAVIPNLTASITQISYQPVNYTPTTPLQVAPGACALWLDAADASTITLSGQNVTQWNDKSGNARNVTGSGSTSPLYVTQSLNNLNGIQMANTATLTTPSFPLSPTNLLTCFVIVQPLTTTSPFTNINFFANSVTYTNFDMYLAYTGANSFQYRYNLSGGGSANATGITISANNTYIFELTNSSSTMFGYINGTGYATSSLSGTNYGSEILSSSTQGNTYLIYEVVFFNISLTTPQRQQIEGYLAWKWGLNKSLPSTHPYYYNAVIPNLTASITQISVNSWKPTAISGCALWLDAADYTTVALSGANVTSWNDKSGNANNATASSSNPTYPSANSINGKQMISFGATQYLSISSITISLQARSIFLVLYTPSITSSTITLFSGNGGTGSEIIRLYNGNNIVLISYNLYQTLQTTANAPTSSYIILSIVASHTSLANSTISVNGTPYTLNGSSGIATGFLTSAYSATIGINTSTTAFSIGEYIHYSGEITQQQQQQIEGYLAWKWGLTSSLPNNHPNKYMPPS